MADADDAGRETHVACLYIPDEVDPVTARARELLARGVDGDFATYVVTFCRMVDVLRRRAGCRSRFGVEAHLYAATLFPQAADMAIAGFEAAIPAQVAVALYAVMESRRHVDSMGFWGHAVSRRGRVLGDLYLTLMQESGPTLEALRGTDLQPVMMERLYLSFEQQVAARHAPRMAACAAGSCAPAPAWMPRT